MDGSSCLRPLGAAARAAVERIVKGKTAWVGARRLKKAVLEELTAGPHPWAEVASLPRRDVVTLSPLAAEVLGVESVGPEDEMAWHWEPIDEDRPQPNELVGKDGISLNHPDFVADPRPTPLEYLIDLETGRQTDDEAEALVILSVPVRVDRRAQRKRAEGRQEPYATGRYRPTRRGKAPRLSPGNCPVT
jgi:hypothetical protein